MRFIIILLIFIPVSLFSQSFPYSTILSEKAVNTIENISASIVSDSFSPMTHYSEGDMTLSAVPSWFRVTRLSDDIEMNENDLSGRAFGIGGGSALSDDLLLYCIVSGPGVLRKSGISYILSDCRCFPLLSAALLHLPLVEGL